MNAYEVKKYLRLRTICTDLGAVNNPHNFALMGGYRCETCGLGHDGTIVLPANEPAIPAREVTVTIAADGETMKGVYTS